MIEANGLTKRFGPTTAVDRVTFTVRPGIVTGFLGPNGAGKSTTMRMVMGLDRPTAGTVTVNGRPYAEHRAPLAEVGALLEARAMHPGRSARQHLLALAATHGIPARRVDEVVELTGLQSVARKRVGGFSLGMGQRLGIATALLGDPRTLILDEPVNGLDPEGVLWVRNLVRYLASEGRTVFLSSHLMSEVALTADHVIVIGKGRILADTPVQDLVDGASRRTVRVRTPGTAALAAAVRRAGGTAVEQPAAGSPDGSPDGHADGHADGRADAGLLEVSGLDAAAVGELALTHGLALHELTPVRSTLEDAYMELTADSVEYRTERAGPAAPSDGEAARPTTPLPEGAPR
jgi:ABC-2 type transport system ATP-binding protein